MTVVQMNRWYLGTSHRDETQESYSNYQSVDV
jgi:hypothetical protein